MKTILVLIAVACLVATAAAQVPWGGEAQRPRWQVYALEGLGALGCGGGCLGVGALVLSTTSLEFSDPWSGLAALYVIAAVVAPVSAVAIPAAAGYGVAKTGEGLGENGSQALAIVGAYVGLPLTLGSIALGTNISGEGRYGRRTSYWDIPVYVLGGLAIPAGAVVGYNLGIDRAATSHGSGSRLQPPGVGLTMAELPDHSVEYGVKVQLAGLRF